MSDITNDAQIFEQTCKPCMTEGTGCDVSVNVKALGTQKTCAELIQMRNQVVSGKSTTALAGGGWHCMYPGQKHDYVGGCYPRRR